MSEERDEPSEEPPSGVADGPSRAPPVGSPPPRRGTPAHARTRPEGRPGLLDPHMLEMLICPLTRGRLEWRAKAQELVSRRARLAYPVRDGVPILLASEAREVDEGELG